MTGDALRGRRVLVTGGAGVIGRELLERLAAQGAVVMCADLKPRPDWVDADVVYVEGDANDLTPEQVGDFAPEYCFHLAATFERTTETEEFWEENFHHNVLLSHHIATLMRELPSMRRYVFASSYLVYDPALYLLDAPAEAAIDLPEDAPLRARNLCGSAKLMHEEELAFLAQFESTPFTAISARIYRVYGRGSGDVVSRWIRSLIAEPDAPLSVYRPEGFFDYIYAGDVAEGLLRLALADVDDPVVNLGSGRSRRVSEVLSILSERFPSLTWNDEPSDIPYEAHQADLRRLEQITGWRPPTTLEQGIELVHDFELGRLGERA